MKKIILDFPISGTSISVPFHTTCSLTNKKFSGEVIIEYCSRAHETLEFVDVGTKIDKYCSSKITVEDLTNWVFLEVERSIPIKNLRVTVNVLKSKAHHPVRVWKEI